MPSWTFRLQRAAQIANAIAAAIAILGLAGWVLDIHALRTLGADFPPVTPAAAVALLLVAGALSIAGLSAGRGARAVLWIVAAATLLIATVHLFEHFDATPFEFGVAASAITHGQRMAPTVSWTFIFLAVALLLVPSDRSFLRSVLRVFALTIAGIALIALVGLTFRILRLYVAAPTIGFSLPTAVGCLFLSFSAITTRPDRRLLRFIESDAPGAVMTRQLLPAAFAVPLLLGWAQALGQRSGLFDIGAGEGGFVAAMIIAYAALILWFAAKLDDMNARRWYAQRQADTERELLQVTLANIGDAVVATDHNGTVRFLNPAAETLTGWSAHAAIGQSAALVFPMIEESNGRAIESPLMRALSRRQPATAGGEPALQTRDGSLRPIDVSAMPIEGEHRELSGGVLVLRDATERRQRDRAMRNAYADLDRRVTERTAELERTTAALRERTALLHTFAASTPDLIVAKDRNGRLIMVNPAALKSIGRTEEEVLGRDAIEYARDAEDAQQIMENDRRAMESGEPQIVEESWSNGQERRTYLVTKSPLCDADGEVIGLVNVATDITERKEAQRELEQLLVAEQRLRGEAEQANRAKDEFLAIVSHELRSPLNALKGWSHVLSSTRSPDAGLIGRATQAIKRNVEHQARLIDDLLDTSRIISGKLVLERRPVNLVETVHAAHDLARAAAAAKGVLLRFSTDHPAIITDGDQGRLQQVVTNLVSNAIKFTPENGVVETTLHRIGDRIELAVRDTGIGISAEFLPHVFDRFSQADTSSTRRHGGLGIGLALVRHLVELHGGRVRADSAGPGRGSTFTVELPAARSLTFVSPRPTGEGPQRRGRPLNGVRAFVVDDDPDARDVIELALTQAGAQVTTFTSGRELTTALATRSGSELPSILLLDLAMPDEDGFALLARVRSLDAAGNIPAIAVTAFTQVDSARLASADFYDRVGKPIDPSRLVDVILAALTSSGRVQSIGAAKRRPEPTAR
jgi:PAS domain S-box-containing protein